MTGCEWAERLNQQTDELWTQRDWSKAKAVAEDAVRENVRWNGEQHWGTAISLHNLGCILVRGDNFAEGEARLKEAIEIRRSHYLNATRDKSEQDLAKYADGLTYTIDELTRVYRMQSRLSEAEPLLRLALEARQISLEDNDREILRRQYILATICNALRKSEDAELFYGRMLAGLATTLLGELGELKPGQPLQDTTQFDTLTHNIATVLGKMEDCRECSADS